MKKIVIYGAGKFGTIYLDVLKEDEVFEVEKIVRNWAIDSGLDLDKLLKI